MSNLEQYDADNAQSIEFFKIKAMQKDSQITNLQAKLKKLQFKHTRDLKQRKIEIDRAQQLLKQQKSKTDKASRLNSELKQQNCLLEARMTDVKTQKEKEVQNVKNKYNQIKEQVRQYERILPTLSFMNELGTTIEHLPTYQDIFMNSKEYSQMYEQLKKKHDSYKVQTQEKIKNLQKAVQFANDRKSQLQKNLKQIVSKNVQLQNQLSTNKIKQQQAFHKYLQQHEQSENMKFQIDELKDQIKQYQYNIEQMVHMHHVDIKAKDDQIMKLTENELTRYQKELTEMQTRHNQREHSLLNQLSILEEENNQMQQKYRKEKVRYQDIILEQQRHVETLRSKQEEMKKEIRDYTNIKSDLIEEIIQLQNSNEKSQFKIVSFEREILHLKQIQNQFKQRQRSLKETSKQTILKVNQDRKELQQRITQLSEFNQKLSKQKKQKENQLILLSHQIQQLRLKLEDGKKVSLDRIPYELEMMRKGSLELIETPVKSRKGSSYISLSGIVSVNTKEISSQTEKQAIQDEQQNLVEKLLNQKEVIKRLQANQKIMEDTVAQKQEAIQQRKKAERGLNDEVSRLKDQISQKTLQLKEVQNKLMKTQKILQQANQQSQAAKKKMWSYKEDYQKIVSDSERMAEQNRKEKESKSQLNKQIRQLKTSLEDLKLKVSELQFQNKNLKEAKEKFEEFKKSSLQKEKLYLGQNQHYKNQIQKLSQQVGFFSKQAAQKQSDLIKKKQEIAELKDDIQKIGEQIAQKIIIIELKDRQIQMLKQSLARQRKQRIIRVVPSLKNLQQTDTSEQSFQRNYQLAGQKQAQKYLLQRQISDLKQQIENIRLKHRSQIQGMQAQQQQYIQEIIKMKLKCAEVDLKASEKQYLYCQIKKKLQSTTKNNMKDGNCA